MKFLTSHSQLLTLNELTPTVVSRIVQLLQANTDPTLFVEQSNADNSVAIREFVVHALLLLVIWMRMVRYLYDSEVPAPWTMEQLKDIAQSAVFVAKRGLRMRASGSRVLAAALMTLGAAVGLIDAQTSHSCVGLIQSYLLRAGASIVYVTVLKRQVWY